MEFTDFFGNKELLLRLKKLSKTSGIPHAIIIEGDNGSGRKSLARYIALLLNCKSAPEVCYDCISCKKILGRNHPDVIYSGLADGRAQIGIEAIRFIRSDAYVLPNESDRKIYIIDNADKMTQEAQNAFLKVLEEPPAYAVFILICNSSDLLLTTVRSRATIFKTERFSPSEISGYLLSSIPEAREMNERNPSMFKLAVMLSYGSIGHATDNLSPELSKANLELYEKVTWLIDMLRRRASAFDLLNYLTEVMPDRQKSDIFLNMLENAMSELLRVKLAKNTDTEFFIDENSLFLSASSLTALFLLEAVDITEKTRSALTMNANIQTTVTAYAWNLCSLRDKY